MRDQANHQSSRRDGLRATVRALASALAVWASALMIAPISATAASGQPTIGEATDEGDVVIAASDGDATTNGGSATPFRLLLPDGAACPGDSASGNWLVQTFLIPAGDDPGSIEYGFSGPEGTQFPLYALDTRPVAHQVTQVATTQDGEGVINELPEFSFAVFPPGYVEPGVYTIGVACEYYRETARYWDTPIVIEANPADQPAQLTWRLPDADTFEPDASGFASRWWIAGIGVAGIGASVVLLGRRRPISPPSPVSPTAHRHGDRSNPPEDPS